MGSILLVLHGIIAIRSHLDERETHQIGITWYHTIPSNITGRMAHIKYKHLKIFLELC
jgi:hypothetical protein